ncbi:MAG: aldehyde dehydrogenase family protein [Ruminococcaceae bacterium]|nr:aldehyde dehydrogenase family protein [Oscillospiraceae bacterium]
MNSQEIGRIVAAQKDFFKSGRTFPVAFRRAALERLKKVLVQHKDELATALRADLGKSPAESYMCEIGLLISEIGYMLKHLTAFAAPRRAKTPLAQFPEKARCAPAPMAPFW